MIRWFRQMLCEHGRYSPIGHYRYSTATGEPETNQTFCGNCGKLLYTEWTDNAGTERR